MALWWAIVPAAIWQGQPVNPEFVFLWVDDGGYCPFFEVEGDTVGFLEQLVARHGELATQRGWQSAFDGATQGVNPMRGNKSHSEMDRCQLRRMRGSV